MRKEIKAMVPKNYLISMLHPLVQNKEQRQLAKQQNDLYHWLHK
jgi:hypothetical protein